MKRTILITSGMLSTALLILLVILYSQHTQQKKPNNFTRVWLADAITAIHDTTLPVPVMGLCPSSADCLFFTSRDPRVLITTNTQLSIIDTHLLRIPLRTQLLTSSELFIDSPYINLITKNSPSLIRYNIQSDSFNISRLPTPLITRISHISPSAMVIRTFDSLQQSQLFAIINTRTGKKVQEKVITELAGDAGFASDGLLAYDNNSHHIFYTQFYQNVFYALDTNLNLLYKGKTIDTINTNQVYSRAFTDSGKHNGSRMPAVPLKRIMNGMNAGNGYLFVLGALHADNELTDNARNNTVVDVYKAMDGQYKGSFYIPNINGKKVQAIQITDKHVLVAVYKDQLATWQLNI